MTRVGYTVLDAILVVGAMQVGSSKWYRLVGAAGQSGARVESQAPRGPLQFLLAVPRDGKYGSWVGAEEVVPAEWWPFRMDDFARQAKASYLVTMEPWNGSD